MPEPQYKHTGLLSTNNSINQPFASQSFSNIDLKRYPTVFYDQNNEELYGKTQSTLDKWGNGLIKMTGLAATTFLSGTVGLMNGIGSYMGSGRFADLYDNPVNRAMDDYNKQMEDMFPNYYTKQETDASWYSPDNILTANFWSDKVLKNLGFSIGAIGGGFAWGSLLKGIGLTNRLVQAGKGMEMVEAVETAAANVPKLERFGAINNTLNNLGRRFLSNTVSPILSNSERGIVSIMGTAGEASMEALGNMNEFRNNLIQQYKNTYGVDPVGEDLDEINAYSDRVGNFTWGMNVALLSATNYIQLPKILGSSKTLEKRAVSEIEKEGGQLFGKWVKSPSLLSKAGAPGKFIDKFVVGPGKYLFAPSEAFEEGAQFAIQKGTEDYFNRAYQNKDDINDFFENLTESLGSVITKGVREALTTKEGLENILIGGISGGLQQARGTYIESRATSRNTTAALNALNSTTLGQQLKDGVKYAGIAINSQKLRQQAIENNDTLNEKDYEKDYALAYILPRIKYGKLESISQEIGHYRNQASTEQGFNELVRQGVVLEGETKDKFIQRLNQVENTAKEVNKTYEMLNDKYSSYLDKDGNRKYSDEIIDKMTYAFAKVNDYDQRLLELSIKLQKNGVNTSRIQQTILGTTPYKEGNVAKALDETSVKNVLEEEVSNIQKNNQLTPEDTKADLGDFTEMILLRQEYLNDFNNLKKSPEQFKEVDKKPVQQTGEQKATIKVKTKDGEEDLEIGTEYFLGKVVEYDKNGVEVYRFPKLTILGENEDGTIQIKGSSGQIKNITKEQLADYKLGKVSDTLGNKKAKFYLENANTLYEHFGIKVNGKPALGRLYYSQKEGILEFAYIDAKGKLQVKEITGEDFKAKQGYTHGKIKAVGALTAEQKKSEEEFANEKDARFEAKVAARLKILTDLRNEAYEDLEKNQKKIEEKKNALESVNKQLKEVEERISKGDLTKRQNFRATTKNAIRQANILVGMKSLLEEELQKLQGEQEEIENNIVYFEDLAENINEMPEDSWDMMDKLDNEIKDLKALHELTGEQINQLAKIAKNVEKALDTAIKFALDLIDRFEKKYPNLPIAPQALRDFLNKDLEFKGVYPGYESYLKANPNLISDLREFDRELADIDELDVVPNERSLNELNQQIAELSEQLKQYEKEIAAKEAILQRFESVVEAFEKQKAEEERLLKNEAIKQEIFKTQDTDSKPSFTSTKEFEPQAKKDDASIFASTANPSTKDPQKPHHLRANYFGGIWNTLKDKADYKVVIITNKMGEVAKSIIDLAKGDYVVKGKDDEVVLAVVVKSTKDGYYYVNQDGEILSKLGEEIDPNQLVFQTMPGAYLETKEGPRYRSTSKKEDVEQYLEQYKVLREEWMNQEEPQSFYDFTPSKGTVKEEFKSYSPQPVTNIISQEEVENQSVIEISTTDGTVSNNHYTIALPAGRPAIVTDEVLTPLENRKLNKEEKETIKQVLRAIANIASKESLKDNEKAKHLFDYLRGIVYWGIPKNESGRNSIWFTTDGLLHFGNNGATAFFTPSGLSDPKLDVFLDEMFNNVNIDYLKSDEPFIEILSLDSEGNIKEFKRWNSYQEYLISPKNPDGTQRSETPLYITTPTFLTVAGEQTREGIYFNLSEIKDSYSPPVVKKEEGRSVMGAFMSALQSMSEEEESLPEGFPEEEPAPKVAPVIKSEETKPGELTPVAKALLDMISSGEKKPASKRERRALLQDTKVPENWDRIEKWINKNLPNVPVYRVKNMIPVAGHSYAWGLFADGAIYLYENAEVGTFYHEVFHAVIEHFTTLEERQALYEEFKSKEGKFLDRKTGKLVDSKDATWEQAEEALAEEFREYVLNREGKSLFGKIAQFFKDLYNWIKSVSEEPSLVDELFKNINGGKYRYYTTQLDNLSYAKKGIIDIDYVSGEDFDTFSTRLPFNAIEEKDLLDHMTSQAFDYLFSEAKNLFELQSSIKEKEFYEKIKEYTMATLLYDPIVTLKDMFEKKEITVDQFNNLAEKYGSLYQKIEDNWQDIVKQHKVYMKTFSIEFDENNELINRDENKTGRETGQDAMKVDHVKNSNTAIKFLFSTLKEAVWDSKQNTLKMAISPVEYEQSSIGGVKLVSFGKAFVQTLNSLANSANFDAMLDNLANLANNDPNYVSLFVKIGGSRKDGKIDWEALDVDDLKVLMAFFKTFSKQSPEVINHYIAEDGSAYLGSGNIANAVEQLKESMEQSFIKAVKKSDLFRKDKSLKAYVVDKTKLRKIGIQRDQNKLEFLKSLGIEVKVTSKNRKQIMDAIGGIYNALVKSQAVVSLGGATFDLSGRLTELAESQVKLTQTGFDSVFFNIDGELQQSFVEKNHLSKFVESLDDIENSQFKYLLTDVFSNNSIVKNKIVEEGFRPRVGYVNGTINNKTGRRTTTDKLPKGIRLLQQINLQLKGWYYSLIPADSATEWMINLGKFISYKDISMGIEDPYIEIFKGYLEDEVNLAKENRKGNVYLEGRSDKLRFFLPILGEKLSEKLVKGNFEEVYSVNEEEIKDAINKFLEGVSKDLQSELNKYGIVFYNNKGTLSFPALALQNTGIDFDNKSFRQETYDNLTKFLAINYSIANIEMHKTIFGDPYLYKDEVKRIKSFLSPAETSVNSSKDINKLLDKFYNEGVKPGDPGYREFKEYVNTAALQDVEVSTELYPDAYVEPDAQGLITEDANREFRLKASLWTSKDEAQYQYDKAWERNYKFEKGEYVYSSKELQAKDQKTLEKGNPEHPSNYITKPIVRGNKYGKNINDVMIDKFSLAPISYRLMVQNYPNSNMLRLYEKMTNEGIDYVVFESARKVGNEYSNPAYGKDGFVSKTPFKGLVKVGFDNFSIQVQTSPKEEPKQRLGSQLTKLATLDLMAAGIPEDFMVGEDENERFIAWNNLSEEKKLESPLYKEIKHNQKVLEEMLENGYQSLLKRLSIKDEGGKFTIEDRSEIANALRDEVLRREVNENVLKTLDYFSKGQISLESTPVYQQFKNILYSIVDKNISSPKVNGGPKVQMASTFFENKRIVKSTVKGKTIYSSDILKEYEDKEGKRYIEVYLPNWFRDKLPKSLRNLSDEELLKRIDPEVLRGVGFRIPTQKQSSIDVFIVKGFLPKEMGDTVVVPSSMVKKTGSDFDIDKLNTYLKNIYVNKKGEIKQIPFFGFGEEAKKKINDFLVDEELSKLSSKEGIDLDSDEFDFEEALEKDLSEVEKWYKQSLQNEYFNSLDRLITSDVYYNRLITPNDPGELKSIAEDIAKLRGLSSEKAPVTSLLNPIYMNTLRHNFVIGKYAVGIGAVNQTNLSLSQRSLIYIDPSEVKNLSKEMNQWLGDGNILLPHNTRILNGKKVISLSEIKDRAGKYISEKISMYLDGYVDVAKGAWIIDLGATPNVASAFLFLEKIGVPSETVAYFMNQPIIVDYLNTIDSAGYSWLFIGDFVDLMKQKYETKTTTPKEINTKELRSKVGKSVEDLNEKERAEQHLILDEFLKYAQYASHLFLITQGSNYDTFNFNDPYLLFKKAEQLKKARTTAISSVDKILENSFINKERELLELSRNAISQILPTDSQRVRNIIERVLRNYIHLNDREFTSTSKKAVTAFLDFILQTYYKYNNNISKLLIEDGNVPQQLRQLIDSLPKDHALRSNPLIDSLLILESPKEGKTSNLKLKTKNSEIYQQNNLIRAFQELKTNPLTKDIYPKILRVSLLQGLSNSPISFTQFLPVEDLVQAMQPLMEKLDNLPDLENFADLNMFERNNWQNTDIVPSQKEYKRANSQFGRGELKIYNRVMKASKGALATIRNKNSDLISLDSRSRVANSLVITISYNRPEFTTEQIEQMKKVGDYSYLKKTLYKMVYSSPGVPLAYNYKLQDGTELTNYFYKAINAWGDSYRLQEYYMDAKQSVVDNGYEKVEELEDDFITQLINPRLLNKSVSSQDMSKPEEKRDLPCEGGTSF